MNVLTRKKISVSCRRPEAQAKRLESRNKCTLCKGFGVDSIQDVSLTKVCRSCGGTGARSKLRARSRLR
jgi:DnaJ-class molecular chaperone